MTRPRTPDPLVQALIAARRDRGWSQMTIALRMDATQQQVSTWEAGRIEPSLGTLRRWAAALDLTIMVGS